MASSPRACHSTDNALVEGKNGVIIRKHMSYGDIAAENADRIQPEIAIR